MQFQTRLGPTEYCTPYDARGVKRLASGKIRLSIKRCDDLEGGYCSAGLLGEDVQFGVYTIILNKRLDGDPAAVLGVWTFDEATKDENDLLEATRWGDVNSTMLYHQTLYKGGTKVASVKFPGRAHNKHRITFTVAEKYFTTRVEAWVEASQKWEEVSFFNGGRGGFALGQMRIAYYLPKKGFTYKDSASRGEMTVDIESITYAPLETVV